MSKQVRWRDPEVEVKTISYEPLQMVSTELHFGARHSAQSQSVILTSDGSRATMSVCGTDLDATSNGDQVVLSLKTSCSAEQWFAQMAIGADSDNHESEQEEVQTWTLSANDADVTAIYFPDSHLEARFWFDCVAFPPVVKTVHAETTNLRGLFELKMS